MTLLHFILLLAVGRLLIWLLQTASPIRWLCRQVRLLSLLDCDLCLGFWVYLFLALFLPAFGPWPALLNVVITAAFSTFVMHLLRLGWQAKFSTVVLE